MSHSSSSASTCTCAHKEGEVCHCDHHHAVHKTLGQRVRPYRLLIIAFGVVLLFASVTTWLGGYLQLHVFMQYLMAGYFLVFGIMQTLTLKKSARMLQQYDGIAKKVPVYGYLYPPLQIILGAAYLLWLSPLIINVIAATVLFFTLIGVIGVLEQKKQVRCGCLGGAMNVSVSWVTLVENAIMFCMAFGMVIYFFASFTAEIKGETNTSPSTHQHHSI